MIYEEKYTPVYPFSILARHAEADTDQAGVLRNPGHSGQGRQVLAPLHTRCSGLARSG